jgi:hypothetical protein
MGALWTSALPSCTFLGHASHRSSRGCPPCILKPLVRLSLSLSLPVSDSFDPTLSPGLFLSISLFLPVSVSFDLSLSWALMVDAAAAPVVTDSASPPPGMFDMRPSVGESHASAPISELHEAIDAFPPYSHVLPTNVIPPASPPRSATTLPHTASVFAPNNVKGAAPVDISAPGTLPVGISFGIPSGQVVPVAPLTPGLDSLHDVGSRRLSDLFSMIDTPARDLGPLRTEVDSLHQRLDDFIDSLGTYA